MTTMKRKDHQYPSRRCTVSWLVVVALLDRCWVSLAFGGISRYRTHGNQKQMEKSPLVQLAEFRVLHYKSALQQVRIWVQDAEEGFVDQDENLEEGETCLRALKAFASNPDDPENPRFLGAGALVKRPNHPSSTPTGTTSNYIFGELPLFDAWIADSIMGKEGGPNLQKLGALKIIDTLFLDHLKRHEENPVTALRSFIIQCEDAHSEYTCASYQAMLDRGFRPMYSILNDGNTIYNINDYSCGYSNGGQSGGNLFGCRVGIGRYREAAKQGTTTGGSNNGECCDLLAAEITKLLPDSDSLRRCTLGGDEACRDHKLIRHLLRDLSDQ